jgi:hypothetical protein
MARGFAGTNTQISGTTAVARNQTYLTMAGWIRRPSSGTIQSWGFSADSANRQHFLHFSDNVMYFVSANGAAARAGSVSQNFTGWNHWAMVFDGSQSTNATRLVGYRNGSSLTLSFNGTIAATTSNSANIESFTIGRAQANSAWSTGDFADLAIWQAALSAAQIASLADGFSADKVAPESLVYYSPLVRDISDVVGGMTLTDASSTVEPHPRIYA